jgi:hypothetical protein
VLNLPRIDVAGCEVCAAANRLIQGLSCRNHEPRNFHFRCRRCSVCTRSPILAPKLHMEITDAHQRAPSVTAVLLAKILPYFSSNAVVKTLLP